MRKKGSSFMGSTPTPAPCFVGIDVSKATLDVMIRPSGEYFQVENTPDGLRQLIQRLKPLALGAVVLEASGGYERPCTAALVDADLPVAVIHPKRARDLARGLGKLAKNDRIDAGVLAYCAEHCQVRKTIKTPEKQAQLEALVLRRRQLVAMRATEHMRLEQTVVREAQKYVRQSVLFLDKHIDKIEKQIAQLIDSDDHWGELSRIIDSVPGIGPTTAATIMAELPELGSLNRQQTSALVGVAPYHNESGKRKGKRSIYGGRRHIRSSLFMATLTATRKNDVIKTFYQRLTAAGKPFKLAMVACMRKLLCILNQMVKNRQSWNEHLPKCA
jgi:transposase